MHDTGNNGLNCHSYVVLPFHHHICFSFIVNGMFSWIDFISMNERYNKQTYLSICAGKTGIGDSKELAIFLTPV